jgi:hypothetical protein
MDASCGDAVHKKPIAQAMKAHLIISLLPTNACCPFALQSFWHLSGLVNKVQRQLSKGVDQKHASKDCKSPQNTMLSWDTLSMSCKKNCGQLQTRVFAVSLQSTYLEGLC